MKLRHEIKHYINQADYFMIKSRLQHIASLDPFSDTSGQYFIRSIYFDNYQDKALEEKLIGLNKRDKFRIRFYNHDTSHIKLEKKSKMNGLCAKVSAKLTQVECESILCGHIDFLKTSTSPVLQELYIRMQSERLIPKTIVDYTREAYIYGPGNVRVTFDHHVKSGLASTQVFTTQLPMANALEPGFIILEVKFDEFLPEIIADVIQTKERRATSISKYALCRSYY